MTLERGALPIAEPASEKDTTSDAETLPTANITAHLETAPNTGMIVYQLKSLHENDMFRRILFIFGVLPQFLKLYTCAGIPGFQVLASMYLIPWVVLELLVVVPARYSVAESPALVNPDLAYINHLDDMVIWMCYFAVHYSDYATIPYLNVYLLPDKTSQIPGHKLLNEVVYIWKSSASMLLSYFRLWFPFFYAVLLENMTYIPLVVCLARPGVPTAMWIICLRAGRFLSMHGVRVRTAGRHMTTPSFKHQPRTASIAFFLMQVVGAVGLFCILYDPKGTSKPSWALFLV